MIALLGCQLIGCWRIAEADLWHREHLGLGGLDILKPNAIFLQQPAQTKPCAEGRAGEDFGVRLSKMSQPTFLANTKS